MFPAKTLTLVPATGERRRYHVYDSQFSKSLRDAVRTSGISKRVGAHTLRHSFASHLLLANYDIRTIQEMMGHSDVKTTMIYTQTVPSRTLKNRQSPLDMTVDLENCLIIVRVPESDDALIEHGFGDFDEAGDVGAIHVVAFGAFGSEARAF